MYPIHKKGNKQNVENYRPISILSCFSKLLDSIVSKYISEFLLLNIAREQHEFTRGRSTITNLLLFTNYVLQSFESSHQVDTIYIDFTKAFDSVSHVRLMQKVWNIGIRGNLCRWLSSYLDSRTQFVRINDCLSHGIICTSGVPQRSHLGPILFNILINDLVTSTHFARCLIYADDVKLYSSIASVSDAMNL